MNPNPAHRTSGDRATESRPVPSPIALAVLLPIGALANLFDPKSDGNPHCVARGRDELDIAALKVTQHIATAKGTGQLAIAFGVPMLQRKLIARVDAARGRPPRPEPEPGEWPTQPDAQADVQVETRIEGPPASQGPDTASVSRTAPIAQTHLDAIDASNDASALAIPSYDTLSASQIVERLAGLNERDRDLLRRYELANRKRRTILGKIDQLQAASS